MKFHLTCIAVLLVSMTLFATEALSWTVTGTGITECQDEDGQKINCPQPGQSCFGQDANYTRPAQTYNLGDTAAVVDPHTNLTWQRNDDDIQRAWQEAKDYCAALRINDQSDWRLPSIRELETTVDFKCANNLCINVTAFPNTELHGSYWTATDDSVDSGKAWIVTFAGGTSVAGDKSGSAFTRCVSGASLSSGPYSTANGVVSDAATGLMWEQADSDAGLTWSDALAYCQSRTTGGYEDWRLPNIRDLESIVDFSRNTPALPTAFTVTNPGLWFWTGSPYSIDNWSDAHAYGISIELGYTDYLSGNGIHALCVRGGLLVTSTVPPLDLLLLSDE